MRWRSLLIQREKMLDEHHPKVCRWLWWVG